MFSGIDRIDERIVTVPECGCWIWTGAINSRGYGTVTFGNRCEYIHRFMWRLHRKKPIPDGMVLMHRCDTRCCCNPDHLRPGSHRANMRDMVSKDRSASLANGRHWAAKLGFRIQHDYYMEPANNE